MPVLQMKRDEWYYVNDCCNCPIFTDNKKKKFTKSSVVLSDSTGEGEIMASVFDNFAIIAVDKIGLATYNRHDMIRGVRRGTFRENEKERNQ